MTVVARPGLLYMDLGSVYVKHCHKEALNIDAEPGSLQRRKPDVDLRRSDLVQVTDILRKCPF